MEDSLGGDKEDKEFNLMDVVAARIQSSTSSTNVDRVIDNGNDCHKEEEREIMEDCAEEDDVRFLLKLVHERQHQHRQHDDSEITTEGIPGAYAASPGAGSQRRSHGSLTSSTNTADNLERQIQREHVSVEFDSETMEPTTSVTRTEDYKLVSPLSEAATHESPPHKDVTLPNRMQWEGGCDEEQDIPQPVGLRREQGLGPAGISRPGAFPCYSTRTIDATTETQTQEDSVMEPVVNSTLGNEIAPAENYHDSGLAMAHPVLDDEGTHPNNLTLAQDYDVESKDRIREKRMKEFKTKIFLAVIGLLVITLILVAIVTPGNKNTVEASKPTEGPTHNPSQSPTLYSDYWLSLFPTNTKTAILNSIDSPQTKAYIWLLEDIESLPFLSHHRIKQKFALAVLYFATGGENWLTSTNWLNHTVHECDWFTQPTFSRKHVMSKVFPGFLAGFLEPPPSTNCDNDGQYLHLWLDQNDLGGSLPEELYMLTSLQTLSIDGSNLVGTISSLIGQLNNLKGLSYVDSLMTGTIPSEVGLFSNMSSLLLSRNKLDGPIPSELWSLTKLDTIILTRKNLQGKLPTELGIFSKLRWIILEGVHLTGIIPTELGQIETFEKFILYHNQYSGTLPSEIGMLSNMSMLTLSNNNMVGTLPSELGLLTGLTGLFVRNNQLSSQIPSEIGLLTNLVVALNFQDNEFLTGTIPTELGQLTQLHFLKIQGNQLSGKIPTEFGGLSALGALNLASNNLSGLVPQELSALQETLHTLALHGNPLLDGTIPDAVCSLNGTCTKFPTKLDSCAGPQGLLFDCTDLLCGCGCSCEDSKIQNEGSRS
ncbi:LRR receptor-like serine threonine-protein kinase [Seminavis robusta]|uniref:LRR receptor-like serine threonine-protein kinase n=1 Tax=Seminavis robusta TaxID=568900 RepID=A0A9N8DFK8_9STRA|nr:LRR receptor-like serine threonine-protein kinase [Seminavis robusta]|eukprot:Sro117_g057520.1 LRR receptor-like serine threonine-protein kinase (822) ;mRNA; f:105761-108317